MRQTSDIIRGRIMRRVWCVYLTSVFVSVWTLHGFILGLSATALWQLVSVPSIVWNLLNTAVKDVPSYVVRMFLEGDALVVLLVLLTVASSLAVVWRWSALVSASQHLHQYYGRDTAWS